MLAHELAHVARWDDTWMIAYTVVRAVFWFHPVAWIVTGCLAEEQERLCDDRVLGRERICPRLYGRSVLDVLRMGAETREAAPSFGGIKKRFEMRLENIATSHRSRPGPVMAWTMAAALGALLLPMAEADAAPEQDKGEGLGAQTDRSQATPVAFVSPLPGADISSGFGKRRNPFTGTVQSHAGVDLLAERGRPIMAPAAGQVSVATPHYRKGVDLGTVVVLDHGQGVRTLYAHLGELVVEEGDSVDRGEVIALVGTTGKSTAPHLHFEIWEDDEPVDPAGRTSELRQ